MRILITALFITLTLSTNWAVAASPMIQVIEAKWSGKDVSELVRARLNGLSASTYKVSRKFIGSPADPTNLNFELKWNCQNGYPDKVQNVSVLENTLIQIECTVNSSVLKSEDLEKVNKPLDSQEKNHVINSDLVNNHLDNKVIGLDSHLGSNYTEKLLRYEYSFHHMIYDPAPDQFENSLKPECVIKLRNHLNAGHTFYVSEIEQATIPADEYQSKFPDYKGRYFHRTNAKKVIRLAKNQDFHSMYQYIRNLKRKYYIHLGSVFVADHPSLMDKSGPYLIEITPTSDTRFLIFPGVSQTEAFKKKLQSLVLPWVASQYPELLECYKNGTVDNEFTGNAIDYLALEGSGAEWVSHAILSNSQFFFIINPFTIEKMAPSTLP